MEEDRYETNVRSTECSDSLDLELLQDRLAFNRNITRIKRVPSERSVELEEATSTRSNNSSSSNNSSHPTCPHTNGCKSNGMSPNPVSPLFSSYLVICTSLGLLQTWPLRRKFLRRGLKVLSDVSMFILTR